MRESRWISLVERNGYFLIAITFAAAGFLFLVGAAEWSDAAPGFLLPLPISGWLRSLLVFAAGGACAFGFVVMLVSVLVEARRSGIVRPRRGAAFQESRRDRGSGPGPFEPPVAE